MKANLKKIAYELFAHIVITLVMLIMIICFFTPQ
jgi:hypothetical protein